MTNDLITFCQVRSGFSAEGLTLPCSQPALVIKNDWKAAISLKSLPVIHTDFFHTPSFKDRWAQIIFITCHHHCLFPGLLVVRLIGQEFSCTSRRSDRSGHSRWIFTVRHFDFPDYYIVYKPPKVRKYANKIDQLARMQGKIYRLGKWTDVLN